LEFGAIRFVWDFGFGISGLSGLGVKMDLYEAIEQYLKDGKAGMLATVIHRAGSAPRDAGAKMFVGEDGKIFGTVGGGRLESDAYNEAIRLMGSKETEVFYIRMDGNAVAGEGMLCGGNVDILLEPAYDRYVDVYRTIGYLEKRGGKGVVVTRYGRNLFSKTLIEQNLDITGDALTGEDIEKFRSYISEKRPLIIEETVIEPLQPSSVLYIFGAGHVSQFLSKVAKMVDFRVVVIDDREDFANRERFPEADEIMVEDFHRVFDHIRFSGGEFVAIVTRGHKYDAEVLGEILKRPARYTGMIGSRRKVKIVLDHMRETGFDEKTIGRVYAPIGIDIKAETPQEIAISIVAEMIKTRGEN
jgi:xanthine dehydrogenase accessory factor